MVDLDLAQVRGFAVVAEHLHFGRAAAELSLSQQALSKRIQRLEGAVGTPLFLRGPKGVALTAAGQSFLPHARQLLADADAAVAAARPEARPLRVDAWGHAQEPLRIVNRLITQEPELAIQLSMRRSTQAALEALHRGEIDAAFGRLHDLAPPHAGGLAHRPARLAPVVAAVSVEHPLAEASVIRPAGLRRHGLWISESTPPEVLDWYRRLAEHFGIPIDTHTRHLGVDDVVHNIGREPHRIALVRPDGADLPRIHRIPVSPTPLFPWSLIWRAGDRHPLLTLLRRLTADTGRRDGWLAYDPQHDWIPDIDLTALRHRG